MDPETDAGCFTSTAHFLLGLLSKLRDLLRGRGNPAGSAGENATFDGLSDQQQGTCNKPPAASSCQTRKPFRGGSQLADTVKCIQRSSDDEDVCPTCLEDYDSENPKITTRCCHHFHLGCIYEWKERSDRCPVCYRVMVFEETI